jgi:hypothetical protein
MKNAVLIIIGLAAFLLCAESSSPACAQAVSTDTSSEISSVTLYSPLKYKHDQSRAVFDFQRGVRPPGSGLRWDLGYGFLYAGNEFDWLQSSSARGHRSVIRELGKHDWTDNFAVPEVEPLAKLKPGEQRRIGVDTSGADGADGADGLPGARGEDGADGDGVVRSPPTPDSSVPVVPSPRPSRPKHDGKPKIDPLFVKAIPGQMYVIHVVDDVNDFYALFRVEALETGDNCTISWKRITAPTTSAKAK